MTAKSVFTSDIARELMRRSFRWGILLGVVCGALAGLPIFGIGALFGMVIGMFVGAFTGTLSGWGLYAVTTSFFLPMPQSNHGRYRIIAAFVCIVISLGMAYVVQNALLHPYSDITSYLIAFIFIPVVLAALWSSQNLATWYIRYSQPK